MVQPSTAGYVSTFVVGLVVGVLIVSAAGGGVVFGDLVGSTSDGESPSGPDPQSPPASIATGTGCLNAPPNAGWLHEVATGQSRTLTANVSVAHGPGETVNASLARVGPGSYQLRVNIVDAEGKAGDGPDCPTGSTVEAGVALPTEYDRFDVVVDGTTVGSMTNDGDTTADLRTFSWNASD